MTQARSVRWSKDESKVLANLFETQVADPRFTKAAEIDPIKEKRDEFKEFTAQQFRNNYKTCASNWMAGKAIEGTRLKDLNREWVDVFYALLLSSSHTDTLFSIFCS